MNKPLPHHALPREHVSEHRAAPAWYEEFGSSLTVRSQFVLSGNTRDLYVSPTDPQQGFLSFEQTLWRLVHGRDIHALLLHDPVDGLRLHSECDPRLKRVLQSHEIILGNVAETPQQITELWRKVAEMRLIPTALVIDYSSHLARNDAPGLTDLFLTAHKQSRIPVPPRPKAAARAPLRNPTIWVADRAADLPDWFVVGNDDLREIVAELPTLEDRFAFARTLLPHFPPHPARRAGEIDNLLETFALQCDRHTLVAMRAIADMAHAEGLGLDRITDVIAMYRTGARRNPWKSPVLKSRMRNARDILTARVKGQDSAIDKTLDILMRSVTGLSGAQTGHRQTRPRGVLLFAGPTGVGKTELAKSVTELLFGDETACHRFDMSEFMEEASVTRLIGAPPGHPGHDRGGELINAIHKRPFSVFLFDEIEKAHPRILDTFLQILDEGRITDSRGATAYFSEALIIFTSNIGMFGSRRENNMGMNVMPSDPHNVVEQKINKAVQDHFRFELKRPELMNRIGHNVVVFDFIDRAAQGVIFSTILKRVFSVVTIEQEIDLRITDEARAELEHLCTQDVFDGGRGIGNRIETHLINPMSRALFFCEPGDTLEIALDRGATGRSRLAFHPAPASSGPSRR
ncbi:AAA family ATPase [Marimonas arenosa]|uniref:AAA family ATPase n=1 Tax=Marimonas arenosa TaxID=1795305 RepID=A0AAE4B506_9RHOB|nr:AAA family ATPase [Marimonas arenosa]MDQ2089884.1 AAA family ATPase [Marimonas arenosa]